MIKKFSKKKFFQCLALPKDPQSFCPYVVKAKKNVFRIFQKNFFIILKLCKDFTHFFFQKNPIGSGWNNHRLFFHPLGDHRVMELLCMLSTKGIFVTAIRPTSNWNFLKIFAFLEHLDNSYGIKKFFWKNLMTFFLDFTKTLTVLRQS